jgi:S-adenosylmethionine decarboxylase
MTSTALSRPSSPTILADDTSPGPFEGPEKLLEVWFAPSAEDSEVSAASTDASGCTYRQGDAKGGGDYRGLRRVPREVWEEMLDIVKCKVLSVVEGEELDAYLLR